MDFYRQYRPIETTRQTSVTLGTPRTKPLTENQKYSSISRITQQLNVVISRCGTEKFLSRKAQLEHILQLWKKDSEWVVTEVVQEASEPTVVFEEANETQPELIIQEDNDTQLELPELNIQKDTVSQLQPETTEDLNDVAMRHLGGFSLQGVCIPQYHQVLTYHSCKKESSLVAYHASLYFQGYSSGVQVST